jgi:hypothetical protein
MCKFNNFCKKEILNSIEIWNWWSPNNDNN